MVESSIVLKLLKRYEICPRCSNRYIGGKEGTIEIRNGVFRRSCKCGFSVEVADKE